MGNIDWALAGPALTATATLVLLGVIVHVLKRPERIWSKVKWGFIKQGPPIIAPYASRAEYIADLIDGKPLEMILERAQLGMPKRKLRLNYANVFTTAPPPFTVYTPWPCQCHHCKPFYTQGWIGGVTSGSVTAANVVCSYPPQTYTITTT
jgi:hypothetical protein